jgi:hypothetical protein
LAQSTSILFIAFNNHPYVFRVESSRFWIYSIIIRFEVLKIVKFEFQRPKSGN